MKEHACEVCGRKSFKKFKANGMVLCNKHYKQWRRFGKFTDTSPLTQKDRNTFETDGAITRIQLRDVHYNVIGEAMIDTEDLPKVRYTKWRLSHGYANNASRKLRPQSVHMHHAVLEVGNEVFVDHINHDTLDNRKKNLRIVTKSQNAMNMNSKGVSWNVKASKWYAYIKKNRRMVNLGMYTHEEEALLARWYAEQFIFGEYAYPKEKPFVPEQRDEQIKAYVKSRLSKHFGNCND